VIDQLATRRLRIIKYRGSAHGTNEYPFLIDENGISVIPITSLKLEYTASREVISTGHTGLDKMFSLGGIYKGSNTLITGSAGTSKTILAAHFAVSSCEREEKVLYFSFEESMDQLVRNMATVGLDMESHLKEGNLIIHASRPSLQGLEMHLLVMLRIIREWEPHTVVVDPISSLITIGKKSEVRAMLIRLIDVLKVNGINALFTSLTSMHGESFKDETIETVSSLADTWIELTNVPGKGVRKRHLMIVKTRGMGHYNNPLEFIISEDGITFENIDPRKLPAKTESKGMA
jgi:circadian clock protein KaiC